MKKILLTGAFLCGAFLINANAQTIMTQNFETVAMPTGWHQQAAAADPTNEGWKFGTNTQLQSQYFVLGSPHTNFTAVNDDKYNSGASNNKDTLYTSNMNLSSYSHVVVSFDFYYYQDVSETATLAVSTNGGTSWTTVKTLTGSQGADTWSNGFIVDLSAYAGSANVMLAFTYGDGGVWEYGFAIDNVSVFAPYNYDLAVQSQNLPYYIGNNVANTVSGSIYNNGTSTITSMNLNYSVNGGAAVTDALSSLSIPEFGNYNFSHNIAWTPTSPGMYTMKIWADNLNGNVDQNHVNDTLTTTFNVLDSIQVKVPMIEEFSQASCDPCFQAMPFFDATITGAGAICNNIRYHPDFPGVDYIDSVTNMYAGSTVASSRLTYYGVDGVPDGKLDGTTDFYPGSGGISVAQIQQEATLGSPFKISVSAIYTPSTNTYTASAVIKAYGAIPAGYTAQVVLTPDTIKFAADQSTEDPNNNSPYLLNFPNAVEAMMTTSGTASTAGNTLAAFTAGQTQTVNVSWVKNHPWASSPKTFLYDSIGAHVTVFIQNNATKFIYQSATCVPSIALGIEENSSLSYLDIYPNPASTIANVAFGMKQAENVTITVYNIVGQKVLSENEGVLAQGEHTIQLNASALTNGLYFVNIITNNNSITKKIVITK